MLLLKAYSPPSSEVAPSFFAVGMSLHTWVEHSKYIFLSGETQISIFATEADVSEADVCSSHKNQLLQKVRRNNMTYSRRYLRLYCIGGSW